MLVHIRMLPLMKDFVKGFGQVKKQSINVATIIETCCKVMSSTNQLGFTGATFLEAMFLFT